MENNLKFLEEQKAEKVEEMRKIVDLAKSEKRALTDEELEAFNQIKASANGITESIRAFESLREERIPEEEGEKNMETEKQETAEKQEVRAFLNYIKNIKNYEKRTENLDMGNNGAIIPTTIAKKIIERVKDICPIYSLSEIYHVRGTLVIPYYGDDAGEDVSCTYHNEFEELTNRSGKFTSVELTEFLAGTLTKISKSLINNNDFGDNFLVNFIVNHMSDAIAEFIEKELIKVTGTNAYQGVLTGATNIVKVKTAGTIKDNDLVTLQESIPDLYQKNAIWIMNKKTRTEIRKLKDGNGNYMLNPDLTSTWGYTLLGKPVYTTDSMPEAEIGEKAIIYGDLKGLTVNIHEDMNIEVLREKYATQHAIGVVGWLELDSKVTDQQKFAVLEV